MSTGLTADDYEKLLGLACAENDRLRAQIKTLEHRHKNDEAANRMLLSALDHQEKRTTPGLRIAA